MAASDDVIFTVPRLVNCEALARAVPISAAVPANAVTLAPVTAPDVLPTNVPKSPASIEPASLSVTVKPELYNAVSKAFAAARVPLNEVSNEVPPPPPPQAASGRSRNGKKPCLFFLAVFIHFLRKASLAPPSGTSTFSNLAPVTSANPIASASSPYTFAESSSVPPYETGPATELNSSGSFEYKTYAVTDRSPDCSSTPAGLADKSSLAWF